jgi:hypothetical protein
LAILQALVVRLKLLQQLQAAQHTQLPLALAVLVRRERLVQLVQIVRLSVQVFQSLQQAAVLVVV